MAQAHIGDLVVIRGRHVDDASRTGTIVEVRGSARDPLYRVRFTESHEALIAPGPDCVITTPSASGPAT